MQNLKYILQIITCFGKKSQSSFKTFTTAYSINKQYYEYNYQLLFYYSFVKDWFPPQFNNVPLIVHILVIDKTWRYPT